MPISIDDFDQFDSNERRETNAERVLRFLVRNRDKAYKATEIVEATGVAENSVHPVLNRLEERELVRHKEPFWAIGDIERVREAFVFHSTAGFLDDELGTESREEWLAPAEAESSEDDT